MIKKLRWKFTGIMMLIVTLILLAIFGTMYYGSWVNFRDQSMSALENAIRISHVLSDTARRPGPMDRIRENDHPSGPGDQLIQQVPLPEGVPENIQGRAPLSSPDNENMNSRTSFLTAEADEDGTITILLNMFLDMDEEGALELVDLASGSGKDTGILKNNNIRFLLQHEETGGTLYAFVDIFMEQNALKRQLINSLLIGIAALAGFFVLSVFLSRWAVEPVKEAWEQQQQFVADASHELRTPLTVILSNANLLSQSEYITSDPDRQRIGHIQSEAAYMKNLTEDLLTLARSDRSGEQTTDVEKCDLSYIVNTAIASFEPVAFELDKTISSTINENIQVYGDPKKLKQLTDILLDNACKYSPDDSTIEVTLSSGRKTDTGFSLFKKQNTEKEASLVVTNEGTPLSSDDIQLIFRRFYREDPSRGNIPGYGLGLSIAQNIVNEHHGRIDVTSDGISKNSFIVRLPAL